MHARSSRGSWPLLGLLVLFGCGGQPQDVAATDEQAKTPTPIQLAQATTGAGAGKTGSGVIHGSIAFSGTAPAAEKVSMAADPVCQQQHTEAALSEAVVVNANGTLKNVFVYVKEGATGSYPPPSTPATLDQHGCWYTPHVLGVQVGQPLDILNSDATLHNVNAKPTANQPFNIAQPVKGMKTSKKFTKPEIMVSTKCNVHPWMQAYIGVVDHPFFAVSGADGSFEITGLPAGTYTLAAWHERYGTQTLQVTVGDGETATVDFAFEAQ